MCVTGFSEFMKRRVQAAPFSPHQTNPCLKSSLGSGLCICLVGLNVWRSSQSFESQLTENFPLTGLYAKHAKDKRADTKQQRDDDMKQNAGVIKKLHR